MQSKAGVSSLSVFWLLSIVFTVSRFLYFDAEQLLPTASVHYSILSEVNATHLPDSVAATLLPEFTATVQQDYVSGPVASAIEAPFFYVSKLISGTNHLNGSILFGMEVGALIFIALSIWFIRRFFLNYFNDAYTGLFLVIIFLATPLSTSFSLSLFRPEIIEFCSIALALYSISEWQKTQFDRGFVFMISAISISCLLNPVALFLVPFLFLFGFPNPALSEKQTAKEGIKNNFLGAFKQRKIHLLALIIPVLTSFVLGLFLLRGISSVSQFDVLLQRIELFPQLLLSYRKGIWVYIPFVVVAFGGLFVYYFSSRIKAIGIIASMITAMVIVLLIGKWWSQSSFVIPELLGLLPLLVFPFDALISKCKTQGEVPTTLLALLVLFALFYTQFFTWQIGNSILKPAKLNQSYFNQVLFEMQEPEELNLNRILKKGLLPQDKLKYTSQVLFKTDFKGETEYVIYDLNNPYHRVNAEIEYALNKKIEVVQGQFKKDALLEIKFRYRMSVSACNVGPFAVIDIESKKQGYGYMNFFLESDGSDHWRDFTGIYKIPDIQFSGDLLNFYIWNNGKCYIDIDNLELTVFQPAKKSNNTDLFLIN